MKLPLVLLFALAPGLAGADETRVEIATPQGRIIGTFESPEGGTPDATAPVVLMLHGFTGSRDELPVTGTEEGVFSRAARQFAEAGISSLRIDFLGSGESRDRPWAATTFSSQIADAEAALAHLTATGPGRPLIVLGWSQGGLVAAHLAAGHREISGVILWAPVAQPRATYGGLLGRDLVEKALSLPADSAIEAPLPWGATTTLNGSFFHEIANTDPIAAIATYGGPMLVMVGTQDTVVAPQPQSGELYLRYHDGEERLDVLEMGHDLGALTGPERLDGMITSAVTWIGALR